MVLLLVYPVQYMHNAHDEVLLGKTNVFLEVQHLPEFSVDCTVSEVWLNNLFYHVCTSLQHIVHIFSSIQK